MNEKNDIEFVYNYESTLSNNQVVSKINNSNYTKQVSFCLDGEDCIWKCIKDGNNCKVSSVRLDANWLSNNLEYAYFPEPVTISDTKVIKTASENSILFFTNDGKQYGIQF